MSNSRAKKSKVNAPRVTATRNHRNSSRSTDTPPKTAAEADQASTSAATSAAMDTATINAIISQATGKAAELVLEQLRNERANSSKRGRGDQDDDDSEFADSYSEFSDDEGATRAWHQPPRTQRSLPAHSTISE